MDTEQQPEHFGRTTFFMLQFQNSQLFGVISSKYPKFTSYKMEKLPSKGRYIGTYILLSLFRHSSSPVRNTKKSHQLKLFTGEFSTFLFFTGHSSPIFQEVMINLNLKILSRFSQLYISRPQKKSTGMILTYEVSGLQLRHFVMNFLDINKILYIAEGGFDPPTSGLWAQHASSAPLC